MATQTGKISLSDSTREAHSGEVSASPRAISPFRYPGGKAFLYKYLLSRVEALPAGQRFYAEPFCGGAGAAVTLLKLGAVTAIYLNDADIKVYSAWKSMLDETDRFVAAIMDTPVDLNAWHASRWIIETERRPSFELGFATFFVNRTSRSGIVVGAGPIGGNDQLGKWKIDARFNRAELADRVQWIGSMKKHIKLTREDGLTFLSRSAKRLPINCTLFFVDPPYVAAGGRLYLNSMDEAKHIALSDVLQEGILPHWILTYDDQPLIRRLYKNRPISDLSVTYSLQKKRKDREVLITA